MGESSLGEGLRCRIIPLCSGDLPVAVFIMAQGGGAVYQEGIINLFSTGHQMTALHRLALLVVVSLLLVCTPAQGGDIPLIDAHSQMAGALDESVIIPLMDEAGVRRTILSARNDRPPTDVLNFAASHPDRITAAVRTKGKFFNYNKPKYYTFMKKQLGNPGYQAMGEVLLYHAQKGKKAPEISVYPDEAQATYALDVCLERGWPFIVHIEFKAARGKRAVFMEKLEAMLTAHPEHPFVLIHMGQLEAGEVKRLLAAHDNLHFMTSHCNPLSVKGGGQPWVNIFEGKSIKGEWRALMEAYPDRFILAFDNVWANFWGEFYLKQTRLWQKALSELPPDVAHAIAHVNAERLWDLPPVQ